MTNGDEVQFREVWAALRASWWLPLLGLAVGTVAGLTLSQVQTPKYTSTTQLFVSTYGATTTSELSAGSQFSEQRVTSYAQLVSGRSLAERVVDRLNLRMTPSQLAGEISASAVANTVLINVDVTDDSAERARNIAAAVGAEFTRYAEQLEAPGPTGMSPVKVTVTEQPQLPTAASSPKTARNVGLGLVVGLLVGAGLAVARVRFDRSVKDPEEAGRLAASPVIGTVLRDEILQKQHTIDSAPGSRTAEDYRQLRTNLQFLNVDEPPKVIMVSSAVPAEGKTTLVINLALALADAGLRVTIVEADLRKPKVTRYLGMVAGVGLTNVLAGTADLEEVIQAYREDVSVIAAGPTPPNPGELLASSHMAALLDKLRRQGSYVLIDAPPLLPVADASGLAVHTDGVLLSVHYGATRKDQLQQAAVTLQRVGAKALGVVLNIVPPKAGLAQAYGYGYSYEADVPGKMGKRENSKPEAA